jgi:hypothetical protein
MHEQDDVHHTGHSQDHGGGQSLVPAAHARAGSEEGPEANSPADGTKHITLQRLPPQDSWEDIVFGDAPPQPQSQRRFSSLILIIGVAAIVGAMSGVGTTWLSTGHFGKDEKAQRVTAERNRAVDNALAQVNSELKSLKLSAENAAKANAEKVARFKEAVAKMKAADATGSIPLPALPTVVPAPVQAKPVPAPVKSASLSKPAPQIARLPTLDGWVVHNVFNGGALVEGRDGIYEVYAGDPLPGAGRVDAIRQQDGHWVVVTSRGLIVAR